MITKYLGYEHSDFLLNMLEGTFALALRHAYSGRDFDKGFLYGVSMAYWDLDLINSEEFRNISERITWDLR